MPLTSSGSSQRGGLEAELSEIRVRASKILKRIEEDDDAPRSLTAQLKELEAEEAQLTARLSALPKHVVVRLSANYEAVYRTAIAELDEHLATKAAAPSRNAIRALIEKVVVHAGDSRGGEVRRLEVHGDLFQMLEFAEIGVNDSEAKSHKREQPPGWARGLF